MSEALSILVVDPDDLLRRSLADQLAGRGFAVTEASSAAEALGAPGRPDAVVMDAHPKGLTAVELCQGFRDARLSGPVVVLGAAPGEVPALLAAGASECLAKPYRLGFLVGRLEALLREAETETALRIGGYEFQPLARSLVDQTGQAIHLTEKETAILSYLHRAAERVVPREELLGEVWGYAGRASTHTVETHIYRLRRKLGGDGTLLVTEAGGYRLAVR